MSVMLMVNNDCTCWAEAIRLCAGTTVPALQQAQSQSTMLSVQCSCDNCTCRAEVIRLQANINADAVSPAEGSNFHLP